MAGKRGEQLGAVNGEDVDEHVAGEHEPGSGEGDAKGERLARRRGPAVDAREQGGAGQGGE